ncbi:hypothetical protein EOPP23_08825 [Endozoicomonas sp. OPT23]|uniref:energy transducer TonB n=1 Tax=Endozoicomonas sp. OPT23 TaxID=2072845 RepID=UPI00129BFCB9|nr:energy transducer TonB [Endozoicomonas sp. OPT23]MRI33085.1 hypothetical protein [Endozoicomonas sp. OPT23]
MPRLLLFTLLLSITAHVAVAFYEGEQTVEVKNSAGSIKAPVSLTFATVSKPASKPEPKPEPVKKEAPKPEPKPVVKKVEPKKDVIKLAKPKFEPEPEVKKTPEKKPEIKTEKIIKKREEPVKPEPKKEQPAEPEVVKSVKKKVEVEGVSDQPVFVAQPSIRKAPLKYPRMAKRRNYQGTVQLEVIVDRKGFPIGIRILESSGYKLLDKSAVSAVEEWEFEPQKINDRLVVSRVHVPVAFQLN